MSRKDEQELPTERLSVEIGYFGSINVPPDELWSDPADQNSDDAAELMRLLQERRAARQQGSCSIPGMPGVEPVKE